MKRIINYRALPIFMLCVIVGILLTTFLNIYFIIPVIAISVALFLTCLLTPKFRKYLLRSIMIIVALVMSLAVTNIDLAVQQNYNSVQEELAVITGKVDGLSTFDASGKIIQGDDLILRNVRYTAQDGHEGKIHDKVVVKGKIDKDIFLGDIVVLRGSIEPIEVDPTSHSYISNYRNVIRQTVKVQGVDSVTTAKPAFFDGIKLKTKTNLVKASSTKVGNFIYTMLYGDKSQLDTGIKTSFSLTGLAHIFAVSGLHVGLIAMVILAILKRCKLNKWVRLIIMTCVLGGFSFICCFSPSVMRASIMILIAQLSGVMGYRNDSISTMSCAAVIILLLRPLYLFDLSFILTFFAALGIVMLGKPVRTKLAFLPKTLSDTLSMTISVNIAVFPIIIFYFGTTSLLFMLANMIVVPIVVLAYPLVFIANAITLIMPFMGFLLTPISYLFQLVLVIAFGIGNVPFYSLAPSITITFMVIWTIMLVFFSEYTLVGEKLKKVLATLMVLFFTTMVGFASLGAFSQSTTVKPVFADNYSQDAYYHLKHRTTDYLIINGELTEYAASTVGYYMQREGVSDIEVLVIPDVSPSEATFISMYLVQYGIETVVTADAQSDYFNQWKDVMVQHDYHDKHLNITVFPEQTILTVAGVNMLFTQHSYIEHTNIVYDIVYSNGNLEQAIVSAPQYIVTSDINNPILQIMPNAAKIVDNNFTFKLKSGKISYKLTNN